MEVSCNSCSWEGESNKLVKVEQVPSCPECESDEIDYITGSNQISDDKIIWTDEAVKQKLAAAFSGDAVAQGQIEDFIEDLRYWLEDTAAGLIDENSSIDAVLGKE
jgi:NAD-dependent SIR2 family protein deacetylase